MADVPSTSSSSSSWKWEESQDALVAYGVLFSVLCLGSLPTGSLHLDGNADLMYFVSLAVVTQYIGAHRGLTTQQRQQISIKEGLLAPVFASISLFSCYLIVRFLPDLSISTLLNAYFWMLGTFAGAGALAPLLRQVGGSLGHKTLGFDVPDGWLLDDKGEAVARAEFAPTDVLSVFAALGLSTAYLVTQNFSLNNLMACLIASDILQLIGIRSFRTAGALLLGLLLYDVFWVFASPAVVGQNVMLTVATSDIITGPSRLLFPRVLGGTGEAADFPFSLLGLGDVAIPGLLACLALRFDATRTVDMGGRAQAAAAAISAALTELGPAASASQMADASAAAAGAAFDRFADREDSQRAASSSSSNGNTSGAASNATASHSSTPRPSQAPTQSSPGASSEALQQAAATPQQSPSASLASEMQEAAPVTEEVLQQRTYFVPVMVAYVAGLVTAFAANSITGMGQPALLYIVPATLGAVLITGATRAELQRLWSFTDVPTFGMPVPPIDKPAA